MLPPPGHGAKRKPVQLGLGLRPSGSVVSQLRVAPDGVRVAMLVHAPGSNGNHLLLAAIGQAPGGAPALGVPVSIGTDVRHPAQLTWYDADHLIVLSRSQMVPQLWEVPVNGGSSTALLPEPGTRSIAAAGPANPMAAGLAHGQLALESNLNGTWTTHRRHRRVSGLPRLRLRTRPCPGCRLLPQPPLAPRRLPAHPA